MGENGARGFTLIALVFTGIILFLIIVAGVAWIGTQPTPAPTLTSTATQTTTPTASATPSPTITPTRRPTWTLRPSLTPTITPSPTASQTPAPERLPTLAAARPNRFNDRYELNTWSAEKAAEAARRLREYPDVHFPKLADQQTPAYSAAFIYPALAYQEALLRYPDDLQAEGWRWGLAYSLARLGDPQAVERYTSFLLQALEDGSLPLSDLPAWFHSREPALQLTVYPLPAQPGQLGQSLLILEGNVSLWLLETPDQIQIYPLTTVFDFRPRAVGNPTSYLSADLTGDSILELILYTAPPAGDFISPEPHVFDLSQGVPVELPVSSSPLFDFKEAFAPGLEISDQPGRFNLVLQFYPACPVRIERPYVWNGETFNSEPQTYSSTPPNEDLVRCETILTHAETFWEPRAAAEISAALLPLWPPKLDPQGRLYAEDARYALLFRHAVSLALSGEQVAARQDFQSILDDPSFPQSTWKTAARDFLSTYQSPANLYQACRAAPICNADAALQELTITSGISDPSLAQEYLRTSGVTLRSAGIFDFDLDGTNERWITVQHHPGDRLEFWILAASRQGVRALFLSYIETNSPTVYFSITTVDQPVFQLGPRLGYQLLHQAESDIPYLQSLPVEPALTTYTRDALYAAERALFSGVSPNQVRRDLESALASGRFNCKTHAICDRFYYLLGLAYELNGQPRAAIDTYIQLWWENSTSPLTTVARLKLKYNPPSQPSSSTTPNPYP